MTQEIENSIKEMIKDLADLYYLNQETRVDYCGWLDYLADCGVGYDISREDLSEFGTRRAMELYCMYLVEAGEIEDWDWDGPNQNYIKLITGDIMTRDYAETMANDVLEGDGVSSFHQSKDANWTASLSDEEENVVVFACDGNTYGYEFEDKEDLANIIYDFFAEE